MKFKDYYETLGVSRDVSQDEIKQSYRKLARKYHPDVSKAPDADERFKELGEAYAVLKDPDKRAAYDQIGNQWKNGQDFQPPPDWGAGFESSGREFGTDNSDFFEALFGRQTRNGQQRHMHAKGQDHHVKILIDLADTYAGAKRSFTLRMPEFDAQGHATVRERQLDVNIPKGIRAGQHLRLAGQGSPGLGEGQAGDLYLEIAFNSDPRFRIDGRDIYTDLPLTPWEAALGASVTAPTPEGPVQLTIPPNSVAGRKLRLKGRGIPGPAPGDLYVILTIALPPAENEKAREAYCAMAKAFDFNPRAHLKG